MRILYYDCFAGISGDMNLGALLDLGVDKDYLIEELDKLTIAQEFEIKVERKHKMGIMGTKVDVVIEDSNHIHEHGNTHGNRHQHKHGNGHQHKHGNGHQHKHKNRNLNSIYEIIDNSDLNKNVKKLSKDMFLVVAEAEAKVHGKPIDEIHFHEVGGVDSIVDIIGAAICIDYLKVDKIMSSTVELGGGFVRCAHGIIPVPAPATVEILTSIPIHMGKVNSETTTPTGATILKTMVDEFTDEMNFTIIKTGYGLGTKDFEIPNVLRVYIGEIDDKVKNIETIIEVNIDDMNPELYDYLEDKLFENGALDVYKTSIIMKKGRPAIKLSVLAESTSLHKIENILFVETTTLGLRRYNVTKIMLDREIITLSTIYGDIPLKKGILNGKVIKMKPEYQVCKRLAKENKIPITTIYDEISKIYLDGDNHGQI